MTGDLNVSDYHCPWMPAIDCTDDVVVKALATSMISVLTVIGSNCTWDNTLYDPQITVLILGVPRVCFMVFGDMRLIANLGAVKIKKEFCCFLSLLT